MADSLFNIFGDHHTTKVIKNVSRQPLSNIENIGKKVLMTPIKPSQPMEKVGEIKKSFLSNMGMTVQGTPMKKAFTPRAVNVVPFIYNENTNSTTKDKGFSFEELEFTKPSYKYDNYHKDALDFLPMPELQIGQHITPNTPPPIIRRPSMEFDCSYHDEFFTDDFSVESFADDDFGLPELD